MGGHLAVGGWAAEGEGPAAEGGAESEDRHLAASTRCRRARVGVPVWALEGGVPGGGGRGSLDEGGRLGAGQRARVGTWWQG